MCSRHQPEAGTDSEVVLRFVTRDEPVQVQCGHWVERGQSEGFCGLPPLHDGPCQPPAYEVSD